ncbi:MAG TPA: SCO family protein [Candidatus Acidoferrales bacterium]|nr:SCO family protein [Candidatus Acidoferrales bacterium]
MMFALLLAGLLPFHGVVVAPLPGGDVLVRNAVITKTLTVQTRRYRLAPKAALAPQTGVDAFLDRSTHPWTLRNPVAAAAFVAGLPNAGRVVPVDVGKPLPRALLVDQDERLVQIHDAFAGKTMLLSFIFTRCPDTDVCIAISTKYAQLQHELDPAHFALVEISLDPLYDSPAVLRAYGKQFDQNPAVWTLLTGTGSTIERVLNEFGISSIQTDDDDYIHSDKLFIVTPRGRVAYVIDTAGWDPRGVVAEARAVDGMASNPFERLKLSLIASVVAMCGGSQYAGIVFLEIALFFVIVIAVTISLIIVGRVLWSKAA